MSNPQLFEIAFRLGGSVDASMRRAFQQANQNMQGMESRSTVLNKSMKGLAITGAAAGAAFVAAGAGIMSAVSAAGEYDQAMRDIQVTTGSTAEEMKEMKEISKNLYNDNLGEDWNDLAAAVSTAKSVTKLTGKELEQSTKNALIFRDAFGEEIPDSIKVSDTMMKNFGITNNESFNLLAQGAQKGLDKSGELLDSANEYAPQFAALGFNAGEMFDTFSVGLENGAFNLDKVGDAVKEFNIRSKDGSKASAEAYQALNMDAAKMTKTFAAGGPAAKEAFDTVVEAISKVKDPAEKTAISVGLFGTQAEDLESTVIAAMGNARKQFDMTKNTMETIGEIKYDSLSQFWQGIGRQFETGILIPIGEKVLPILTEFSKAFGKHMPAITKFVESGMEKIGAIFTGVPKLFSGSQRDVIDFISVITNAFGQENGLKIALFFKGIKNSVDTAGEYFGRIKGFLDGIGGLFKDDGQGGRDFLASLGLSEGVIQTLDTWAMNISALRGNLGKTIEGIRGLFKDDGGGGRDILSNLGFSDGLIQTADMIAEKISVLRNTLTDAMANIAGAWQKHGPGMLNSIQEVLIFLWPKVKSAVSAVGTFLFSIFQKIAYFWQENGAQIVQAVSNIFQFIMSIVSFVMPAVLGIIKMIWGNIKGVISGGLSIILGAIKIFSGLFTGDFSKMWEGIKQLFFGAVEFLWNIVQLTFYGKILSGAKAFIAIFRGGFAALWAGIKALFAGNISGLILNVRTGFTAIWGATRSIFTNIWNFLANIFLAIKNIVSGGIGFVRAIFTNGFTYLSTIARTGLSTILTRFTTVFTNIRNAVTGRFEDIVTAAKNLPKKIGDGIGSMASKVKGGVTKVINKLATTLGKGVNGVIGGINWVLGKIGINESSYIDLWTVPQYANGTQGHPGGLAMINDGRGSNAGRELVLTPDGRATMFAGKDVYANLPKGTHVLSAKNTRNLLSSVPAYADGTGLVDKIAGGVKAGWNKAKEWTGNVLDYVKNPSSLLDTALNMLGIQKPGGDGMIGSMASGAWNKVKENAVNFVKGKLNFFSSNQNQSGIALTGGNGGGFGAPFRLTSAPGYRGNIGVRGATAYHNGWDWGAPSGTPIPATHAGLVSFAGYQGARGNTVRVKGDNGLSYIYQHNSRNAVGAGQRVNAGQVVGYVGSTGVSSGPHLHYEVLKGYAKGGRVPSSQPILVGEQGPEIMNARGGSSILSNDKSKSLLSRLLSFGQEGEGTSRGDTTAEGHTFQFHNEITIQGNADEPTIKKAVAEAEARMEAKFRDMLRKFEDEKRRLSFG